MLENKNTPNTLSLVKSHRENRVINPIFLLTFFSPATDFCGGLVTSHNSDKIPIFNQYTDLFLFLVMYFPNTVCI